MWRVEFIGLVAVVLALLTLSPGRAQENQERPLSIDDLGPNPFFGLPGTLEALVKSAPGAVIAQIVGPGTLQLQSVLGPIRGARGYATYQVMIRDVVFHRDPVSTPPIVVGSQVEFTQSVGRESAEAFVNNRIPVIAGDICLLFLWPGPDDRWSILNWHVQFRQSKELPGRAEMLGDPRAKWGLRPEWFGKSVPVTLSGERIMPDWDGLVGEVRRLGRR